MVFVMIYFLIKFLINFFHTDRLVDALSHFSLSSLLFRFLTLTLHRCELLFLAVLSLLLDILIVLGKRLPKLLQMLPELRVIASMNQLHLVVRDDLDILLELLVVVFHVIDRDLLVQILEQLREKLPDLLRLSFDFSSLLRVVDIVAIANVLVSELFQLVHVINRLFELLVAHEKIE